MKKLKLMFLPVLLVILIFGLALSSCDDPIYPGFSSNNDVISYKEFFLSADNVSLETSIRGTIYIRGDVEKPDDRKVQITAWMEIDSNDWGGVSFTPPPEWKITSIVSDYPQGNPKPESYITTLRSEGRKEYDTMIIIGGTKYGAPEIQGGTGNIVIELAPESSDKALPDIFKISIGIGSQNDYIVNPVHEEYELPLNKDYHDVSPYTIHPSPGSYLTDNDFSKSLVALKDVKAEKITAETEYVIPSSPEQTVKKGDTILMVSGHVQNMDIEKYEIALWAEGYNRSGKQVGWTLVGNLENNRIGGYLEYQQTCDFNLYLSLADDLNTVRLYAVTYIIPPPGILNQDLVKLPIGEPVIYEQTLYMMGGANDELYIYADGTVLYFEETGLRFSSEEHPGLRKVHAGALFGEELNSLLEYLENSGVDKLDEYYYYQTEPKENGSFSSSDLSLNLIVNINGFVKRVKTQGYMSPDGGETYPGMPSPLNEIYERLYKIAMTTAEVYQENIPR